MQGDAYNPKVAMENNYRTIQPLNQRPLRTNINFHNAVSLTHLLIIVIGYVYFSVVSSECHY